MKSLRDVERMHRRNKRKGKGKGSGHGPVYDYLLHAPPGFAVTVSGCVRRHNGGNGDVAGILEQLFIGSDRTRPGDTQDLKDCIREAGNDE